MIALLILFSLMAAPDGPPSSSHDITGVPEGEKSFYHGTIKDTLEVELVLTRNGKQISGTYEYASHQQPIQLQGTVLPDSSLQISEATVHGEITGQFGLNNLLGWGRLDGKWNSADGKRSYPVHLEKINDAQHLQLHRMWGDKTPIKSIAIGEDVGCALRDSGAWCWGVFPSRTLGAVKQRALPNLLVPAGSSASPIAGHLSASSNGDAGMVCRTELGRLKCFASSRADKREVAAIEEQFSSDVTDVAIDEDHSCVIWKAAVYCWGSNFVGQLGTGSTQLINRTPAKVELPASPRQVAVSHGVSCALTTTDEVYCWGGNEFWQTGAPSRDTCETPNGHFDTIAVPCNKKPVRVRALP